MDTVLEQWARERPDLGGAMMISSGTVTHRPDRLERRGLVARLLSGFTERQRGELAGLLRHQSTTAVVD